MGHVSSPVRYQNFIGGELVPAGSGEASDNRCPADGELLGHAPWSSADDMDAAVAAAKAAFSARRDTPTPVRGDMIARLARLIEDRADDWGRALSLEEGKVFGEGRGEILKTLKYLQFAAAEARRMTGIAVPSEIPGTIAFTTWRPHGVVGLITPWNFPVCIPLWKIAPAVIAGNTVVLKPASESPWTAPGPPSSTSWTPAAPSRPRRSSAGAQRHPPLGHRRCDPRGQWRALRPDQCGPRRTSAPRSS